MTPEEIVDLIMPPAEPIEVVVEVFGGVAWVPRETPGVVVNIIYYTAEGERILHADEVGDTSPAAADDVSTSSAASAKSTLHDALPYQHRSRYRTRCSCGWVSFWLPLVEAGAALNNHIGERS